MALAVLFPRVGSIAGIFGLGAVLVGAFCFGLRGGLLVYRGTGEDIRTMSDTQFREIYGEEAVRVNAGRPARK